MSARAPGQRRQARSDDTTCPRVYGATVTASRNYMDHVDDMAAVGKEFLTDEEFQVAAAGSNEQTNITGGANPVTTGGHVDTASRRMVSRYGLEDCCGAFWQWLRGGGRSLNKATHFEEREGSY